MVQKCHDTDSEHFGPAIPSFSSRKTALQLVKHEGRPQREELQRLDTSTRYLCSRMLVVLSVCVVRCRLFHQHPITACSG